MSKRPKTYSVSTGTRILLGLTLVLIIFFSFSVRAEIYSWTDKQGVRHFSDRPPEHSTDVHVAGEISHDKAADQKQDHAYHQMMEAVFAQQRMKKEKAETEALKKRLKEAERKSMAAEKKAEKALEAAKAAQAIASEKQRYREVYIIPQRAVGPYPKNRLTTPPSGYFYRNSPQP